MKGKNTVFCTMAVWEELLVPDVLPVHRLKELMTLDLLHAHGPNPVLSVSAIPETHEQRTLALQSHSLNNYSTSWDKSEHTSISSLWPSQRWGLQAGRQGSPSSSSPSCRSPAASRSRRAGNLNRANNFFFKKNAGGVAVHQVYSYTCDFGFATKWSCELLCCVSYRWAFHTWWPPETTSRTACCIQSAWRPQGRCSQGSPRWNKPGSHRQTDKQTECEGYE